MTTRRIPNSGTPVAASATAPDATPVVTATSRKWDETPIVAGGAMVAATPMILFKDKRDLFCLDIDVPGVKLNDLTIYYSNGVLRLIWERLDPTVDATGGGEGSLNTSSHLKQMRFEREIPINTLQIDTNKLKAYLDLHSKPTGVLTIVAPMKLKRSMVPIQVRTDKALKGMEEEL